MENVNLKRKVTLKRKGDTPDQAPEGKKPNKSIWLAILGVVIIGGIFGIKQLNQSNDTTGGAEEVIVSEDVNGTTATPENEVVSKGEEENITSTDNGSSEQSDVSSETKSVTNSTTSVENNVTSKPKSTADANTTKDAGSNDKSKSNGNPNQSGTVSVQGSLEEKVRQVIRGDFGNGKDRKQVLGAEYDVIQAKVNEMYRNGLIE
jgi:preprotein translocase subunit SecF